jgi:DNA-binding transcriptional MerR regulator
MYDDENLFTVTTAQELFGVKSSQTIRNWANEFREYLSPSANPSEGTKRFFTYEDMEVFALVSEMSQQGKPFEEIHLSLANGSRGDLPEDNAADVKAIIAQQGAIRLSQLRNQIAELEAQVDPLKEENIRLKTQLENTQKTEAELKEARNTINTLNREIGRLEARLEIEQERKEAKSDDAG